MQDPKFHLVNDFGISKETIERNFDADPGERDADWSTRVRALLDKPTELYTLDEMADLIKAMSNAHDDRVVGNPDDFTDSQGRPSIEIWQSGQTLERQAGLEERLRSFRASVENAAPPSTAGYSGTMSLSVPSLPKAQQRGLYFLPKSLRQPLLAVGGLLTLAMMGLVLLFLWAWITLSPRAGAPTPAPSVPVAAAPLPGPAINAFAISPNTVSEQQCGTLSWDVGGTVSSVRVFRNSVVLLDNAPQAGTAPDCSTTAGTITFRIEARNPAGEVATREVSLIVNPKPPTNAPVVKPAPADQAGQPMAPTMPQFIVYVAIALIGAYLAAKMTGTRYPFGILGAFIVALVGEWMAINVLHILVAPEVSIAGVPVVTAILGGLLLALLWVVVVHGRQYRRSSQNGRGQ